MMRTEKRLQGLILTGGNNSIEVILKRGNFGTDNAKRNLRLMVIRLFLM